MEPVAAVGIDAGSAAIKVVGIDASGAMVFDRLEPTEPMLERQARTMLAEVLEQAPEQAPGASPRVVATGYGRKLIGEVDRVVTEITCHARGVYRCLELAGTLIDIGGQDSKVIAIKEGGEVLNFAMNDKCAAGTGRFLEVTAARLKIPIERMGQMALQSSSEETISSTCTVFAESEIVSLIARGRPLEQIVRGLHRSLIARVVSLARSIRPRPPFFLSGGVACNPAIRAFLSDALEHEVMLPDRPQLMGAYGAALIALEEGSPIDARDRPRT